jgi:SAM-dependent methyltransferase
LLPALTWAPDVHPVIGRPYAGVWSADAARWLTRPEREEEEQPDKALDAIGIAKGSVVADIGAGSGAITWRLAKRVGPAGKVYANDIQPRMLELLRRNMAERKISNVETVPGDDDDPKLPPASVDLSYSTVSAPAVYMPFSFSLHPAASWSAPPPNPLRTCRPSSNFGPVVK